MAKTKSNFDAVIEQLRKDTAEGAKTFSRNTLNKVATDLMNDPEYVSEVYSKKGDSYEVSETTPVKEYRNELKKVVKAATGVDEAELGKLDTMQLPKSFCAATEKIGEVAIKSYMSTGKTMRFDINAADESAMTARIEDIKETTAATKKIVETSPGKYESVPTGKIVTRKAHKELKTKNKLPGWLTIEKDA